MSRKDEISDEDLKALQGELQASISQLQDESGEEQDPTEEWEKDSHEWKRNQLEVEGLELDLKQRKQYAVALFIMLVFWLVSMLIVVFFQGFKTSGFALTDTVLVALLSTSTVNVIGIYMVVARYIFPVRGAGKA